MERLLAELDVSRETYERLKTFEALVRKWQKTINLVSRETLPVLWDRHILDSAQIHRTSGHLGQNWLDLGSGAGFPGIVNAILLSELHPAAHVTMIESDTRKATFLRTALRETGVTGTVLSKRIAQQDPLAADVVTARALASLDDLLTMTDRHMHRDGTAIFHKGRSAQEEVDAARKNWTFDLIQQQSITNPEARILEIRNLSRAKS